MTINTRLTLQEAHDLARLALLASGANDRHGAVVAQSIAEAEAQGIRNVGLAYLPTYCAHLRCGKVDGHATSRHEIAAPSILQVDAAHGFAHTAFLSALPEFVAMVRSQGIALLTIRRSYSAGVLGRLEDPSPSLAPTPGLLVFHKQVLMRSWPTCRAQQQRGST